MPSMCLYAVKNGGGGMRLTDIILVRLKRKKSGTRPPIISSVLGEGLNASWNLEG